jgi:hypothetical protein
MNADCSGARRLGAANVRTEASMSPDGTRFAFTLLSSFDPGRRDADPEIVQAAFTPFARSVTDNSARGRASPRGLRTAGTSCSRATATATRTSGRRTG